MASSMNVVVLVGNLTRDPESKDLPSGGQVAEFGLAMNSRQKSGDDWTDRVDFIDVSVFGNQAASVMQFCQKGKAVAVQGRLRQDRWQNAEGENRSKVSVVAQNVQFLGSRSDDGSATNDSGASAGSSDDTGW